MAELTIKKIIKKYGGNLILEFDEWIVSDGNYWIKGANGKGKTTLFKIIAGQVPFTGTIEIDDILLHKKPVEYRSKISYAEAEPQYPDFLTGNQLIDYIISIKKTDRITAARITDQFKMTAFINNKVGTYSSGMLKKLSLILAFIGEADLYVLDEPLITIDNDAANVLYQLISNCQQQGKTVLISSHQELDRQKIAINGIFEIDNYRIIPC